jgi:transglutaminase superfamily protein
MRRLKRLAGLTGWERCLLGRAVLVVGITRVALWILPVDVVRRIAARAVLPAGNPIPVDRSAWAVKAVSRYVPGATCLTQALAAQALLKSGGHESRVQIGVLRDAGKFEAHAWVICRDQIVVGGPEVARYVRLYHLGPGR